MVLSYYLLERAVNQMPNLLDVIAVVVIAFVILVLLVDNIRFRSKYKKGLTKIVQLEIDKMAVLSTLDQAIKENEINKSEGFVRFLSESRDAAFEYIESAQAGISEFVDKADVVFEKSTDHELTNAYQKLKSLLPNKPKD